MFAEATIARCFLLLAIFAVSAALNVSERVRVRKCCALNESVLNTTSCIAEESNSVAFFHQVPLLSDNKSFHVVYGGNERKFCGENYIIIRTYEFSLLQDGSLYDKQSDSSFSHETFCLDVFNDSESVEALLCVLPEDGMIEGHDIPYIGMIISMPFLVATLLVYAVLPDRNLHQKALMCYVFFLLFAYVFLVTIQLSNTQFDYITCNFLGFSTLFCFMVSFFWMNVICLDIWFTFSGSRGLGGNKRQNERRRFLYYCAYALGLPSLHIIIAVLINELGDQEQWYHPNVGRSMCFLESGVANLIYMYGPIAILLTINVILFTLTAFKIRQVKKETSMLKHSDSKRHNLEKDKQKFNLYLKLLLAMGVNWSMEVVSWAVEWRMQSVPRYVWYLTDLCNALYGVFIFVIFVFKKKIWRLLQNRFLEGKSPETVVTATSPQNSSSVHPSIHTTT